MPAWHAHQRHEVEVDPQQALAERQRIRQVVGRRMLCELSREIRGMAQLAQHGFALVWRGQHHRTVDVHHAHGDFACLRQALEVDAIECVDRQAGDLHDDKADQQDQRRACGEAAWPQAECHARSTVAART